MSVYLIASIRVNDPEVYLRYLEKADEVFGRYNGRYLAVDEKPDIIEGRWNYTKAVLIEFATRKDFDEWYESADYQEILKYRLEGSVCDTILVKGY